MNVYATIFSKDPSLLKYPKVCVKKVILGYPNTSSFWKLANDEK